MSNFSDCHFHILGPGATGLLWAHALSKTTPHVTLIGRNITSSPQVDGTTASIKLTEGKKTTAIELPLINGAQCQKINTLMVCVKSYQLKDALLSVKHAVDSDSKVILLQNGMGHQETAQSIMPHVTLLLASNTHGAFRSAPFEVTYAGQGMTLIGPASAHSNCPAEFELVNLMDQALPPVTWTQNIQAHLWEKLAINAVINTLTAQFSCLNGELMNNISYYKEARCLILELETLYRELGKPELAMNIQANVENVALRTARNKSSMLQDRINKRPLEIDAISGFVLNQALQAGIEMPSMTEVHNYLSKLHQST